MDAGLPYNPSPFIHEVDEETGEKRPAPPLLYAATSGATPYRLNLHVDDVGHTLIVGPTGGGKSTLLGLLAAQWFRYPDARIFAFDKGNSMLPLTLAVGGDHYEIGGPKSSLRFSPLADIADQDERAKALDWLEQLVILARGKDYIVTPDQREVLWTALCVAAENMVQDGRPCSFRDYINTYLQDTELAQTLQTYLDGLQGLLDADEDGLRTGHYTVFELDYITDKAERYQTAVLLYLFNQIEKRLDGAPTLLLLDEAWLALQHPLFAAKIREWLKTLRKKNCAVVFATQSVTDVIESPLGAVLRESCPTKIFLPYHDARSDAAADAYRQMGLNSRQIELLATARRKRDYYVVNAHGKRMIDLGLGAVALSFVGASGKEDLARVRELYAEHAANWPVYWLRERAQNRRIQGHEYLDGWADVLEQYAA